MDFMKLLKSIEELLYELITWFMFYPLTLWRIVRHPITMLSYAQKELSEKESNQFDDAVSPPILLLLTLVMLHLVEGALNAAWASTLPSFLQDDRNLLIFRALLFSLFPLLYSTAGLRASGARLTRTILKPAFYSQSYATVPFVLSLSVGLQLIAGRSEIASLIGWAILVGGVVWYLAVQTAWFSRSGSISQWRAFTIVGGLFLTATTLIVIVAVIAWLAVQTL